MRLASSSVMTAIRAAFVCALALNLSAQIQLPGQYPGRYPGGQYPGGPFPGGVGIPLPGGRGRTTGPNGPQRGRKNRDKDKVPVITTTGILRTIAGTQFVIEADDHRIITYKTTDKTNVQKDGKAAELNAFGDADHLTVDATEDDNGYFTAVTVTYNMPGTAEERLHAARTWDLPDLAGSPKKSTADKSGDDDDRPTLRRSDKDKDKDAAAQDSVAAVDDRPTTQIRPNAPPPDADDPGPPGLRRGKPAPRVRADDSEPSVESPPAAAPATAPSVAVARTPSPVIPIQEDPVIAKAKDAAAAYSGSLPNFFCRQVTTRYESDHPKEGWQALDTITADLAYEDGTESYKNIKVGNKEQKGSMEDLSGSWSTGEFESLLDDVFDPATGATFRRSGEDTIRGRRADTFTFEVPRERSHWRIIVAAQIYYPAYRGTIWVDRETSRVLRLEMGSRNMPQLFPLEKTETATDWDFIRLSTPQTFLLPTAAEVLSCYNGSSHCSRNRIEFRNYRKFGAESDITFDDKQ
jgi:hypothetical protein